MAYAKFMQVKNKAAGDGVVMTKEHPPAAQSDLAPTTATVPRQVSVVLIALSCLHCLCGSCDLLC